MGTFRLTIEYEGTRYSGWQAQKNTAKTVQGALQRAAAELLGQVTIGGAGRTDAGVHAIAQVAHLRTTARMRPREVQYGLNDRLPHDINVIDVAPASARFHARHDAVARSYVYQISRRRTAFAKSFVWWIRDPLDLNAMRTASRAIAGRHDFVRFADKRAEDASTMVVVDRVELAEAGDLLLVRLVASHFLWRMVRKVVAALAEVGRGALAPAALGEMLATRGERYAATAPPSGLFLESVIYPGEELRRALAPVIPVARPGDPS